MNAPAEASGSSDRLIAFTSERPLERPEVLHRHAVLWRLPAGTAPYATSDLAGRLVPSISPFLHHFAYPGGVFRCELQQDDQAEYTSNRRSTLPFHSDMALFPEPPSVTLIRCIAPEPGPPPSDGALLLLHVADLMAALEHADRYDLIAFLRAPRHLSFRDGTTTVAPMVPARVGAAPLRVFEGIAGQLPESERPLLREVLNFCHTLGPALLRVRLAAGSVLGLSNRHFLHSRAACASTARVTEIFLGTIPTR